MKARGEKRILLSALALSFLVAGLLPQACTDGTTPDCSGDAAASCGPYPNEGGADADTDGAGDGSAADSSAKDATVFDTGSQVDSSGDTDSGDDSGDADGE